MDCPVHASTSLWHHGSSPHGLCLPLHVHLHVHPVCCQVDMTVEEGVELLRMCVKELSIRFLLNQKEFMVKIVDESGTREIAL